MSITSIDIDSLVYLAAGFTGSRFGMTDIQGHNVDAVLFTILKRAESKVLDLDPTVGLEIVRHGIGKRLRLHHGDCVGSDAQAHAYAMARGIGPMIHPPSNSSKRAFCKGAVHVFEPKGYHARDRDIVTATDILVAAPKTKREDPGSGTWYTINEARNQEKDIVLCFRDGLVKYESYRPHGWYPASWWEEVAQSLSITP